MRLLIVSAILGFLPPSLAFAQQVFGPWMIFPGPNPDARELLPDADPETTFRIGQLIFDYPTGHSHTAKDPVRNLVELPPVAEIVNSAEAPEYVVALVQQQLPVPHRFELEKASVIDYGDAGWQWHVTYALYPEEGGFTGVPFRYLAILDGRGNVVPPQLAVFDAYFRSVEDGWVCSILRPVAPQPKTEMLAAETIRERATHELGKAARHWARGSSNSSRTPIQFENQERMRFPIATDDDGALTYVDIWAVNFRDPAQTERPDEIFTIWVTPDGRVAELRQLDLWSTADETDEREPE